MRNGNSSYTFDPIGNRREVTLPDEPAPLVYASNPLNQYTNILCASVPSVVDIPTYDEDGNMLLGPAGPDRATLGMVWDAENRLVAVTNGNTVVLNDYDYRSRRIRKRVLESDTLTSDHRFLYDGWNLIAEHTHTPTLPNAHTNFYVWGLDLSGTLQGTGGVGGLLLCSSGAPSSESYVPAYDANGNITEYLATNGVTVAHREYDPFGGTVVAAGDADAFTHWFNTKPWCPATGLSEYLHRKYSPRLGRWMSRDPTGEGAFLTQYIRDKPYHEKIGLLRRSDDPAYAFVMNGPLDRCDPFGLWAWSRYQEDKNSDGSTTIAVGKKCTIVVLFGHGLSATPHAFKFEQSCTAGGFVGCDAGSTNTKIPNGNRIDDAKLTDGDLHLGGGSGSLPEDEQFHHWLDKAKEGARSKAKTFCKDTQCCCKTVVIYGELAGSAWDTENWPFPGGWEETINCDGANGEDK